MKNIQPKRETMNSNSSKNRRNESSHRFIFHLTWVDAVTLTGVVLTGCALALIIHGKLSFAMSVLYLAMIVDALDGMLARKYGLERDFGRYLDGFVDMLDYLVAPGLFLYVWGFDSWFECLVILGFVIFGIIRLSVFNETGNIKNGKDELAYQGMPVFWSLLILGSLYLLHFILGKGIVFPLTAVSFMVFSFYMVLNRPFYKFKSFRNILIFVLSLSAMFLVLGMFGL